jgi:hypothetical protein
VVTLRKLDQKFSLYDGRQAQLEHYYELISKKLSTLIELRFTQEGQLEQKKEDLNHLAAILGVFGDIGIFNKSLEISIFRNIRFVGKESKFLLSLQRYNQNSRNDQIEEFVFSHITKVNFDDLKNLQILLNGTEKNYEPKVETKKLEFYLMEILKNSHSLETEELADSIDTLCKLFKANEVTENQIQSLLKKISKFSLDENCHLLNQEYQILYKSIQEKAANIQLNKKMENELKIAKFQNTQNLKNSLKKQEIEDLYHIEEIYGRGMVDEVYFTKLKISILGQNSIFSLLLLAENFEHLLTNSEVLPYFGQSLKILDLYCHEGESTQENIKVIEKIDKLIKKLNLQKEQN